MSDPITLANQLAESLRASEEYRAFVSTRETAYADQTNKALLDEYKKLQFRLQACMASGSAPDEDEIQRLRQIASLLQFNKDASDYIMAEFRYQKLLSDIYKILADTAGIDLDTLLSNG